MMSLRDRCQNRLLSGSGFAVPKLSSNINFDEESDESDIDDDIAIGDLTQESSANQNFTKVKQCKENITESLTLREIIANKECKEKTHANSDYCAKDKNIDNLVDEEVINKKLTIENKVEPQDNCAGDSLDQNSKQQQDVSQKVPRKRKLTEEEKKAAKEKKEAEKLEKQRIKEELKKAKEKEKAVKKVAALNNKVLKKEECLDKILVFVDGNLVNWIGGISILDHLQKASVDCQVKPMGIASLIAWLRRKEEFKLGEASEVVKECHSEEAEDLLLCITALELVNLINAEIANVIGQETLNDRISNIQNLFPNKRITFVVTGMNKYYSLVKTRQNQMFRSNCTDEKPKKVRKKAQAEVVLLTEDQINNAITSVEIISNITFRLWEDEATLGTFVYSFTRAIGEAPTKKSFHSSLQFAKTANTIQLSQNKHGMLQLWNQQLQQFYGVSHEVSTAISQKYPDSLSLMKEYKMLSEEEGLTLLEDIEVRRGVGVLESSRRVGPILSKKFYKLFTSTDGNECLAR